MIDLWGHAVNRWHQSKWPALRNSHDDTHAHSERVALLILHLWPDVHGDLIIAALIHDDAEGGPGGVGDVCGPSKVGEYCLAYERRTELIEIERGTDFYVALHDRRVIRFADRLDAYRWVKLVEPRALKDDGWPECRDWLEAEAKSLGVWDKVKGMIE